MSISEPSRTSPSDPVLILMEFLIVVCYNWILVVVILEIWGWNEVNVKLKCQGMYLK